MRPFSSKLSVLSYCYVTVLKGNFLCRSLPKLSFNFSKLTIILISPFFFFFFKGGVSFKRTKVLRRGEGWYKKII